MSDTAPAAPAIIFGTDGWRARIGEDYTYDNVRRCAQGVAEWVIAQGTQAKGVVVGYDRRFSSEHFAVAAAEVIAAHDIGVMFATEAIPTQVTSYEVVERGAAVAAHEARIRGPQLQRADRVSESRAGHAQAFGLQQARSFAVGGHEGGIAGAVSYSRVQHARRRG